MGGARTVATVTQAAIAFYIAHLTTATKQLRLLNHYDVHHRMLINFLFHIVVLFNHDFFTIIHIYAAVGGFAIELMPLQVIPLPSIQGGVGGGSAYSRRFPVEVQFDSTACKVACGEADLIYTFVCLFQSAKVQKVRQIRVIRPRLFMFFDIPPL